MFIFWFLAT